MTLGRLTVYACALLAVLAGHSPVWSQGISPRFDVTCSVPVKDSNGAFLTGNNPAASKFGLPALPGSLVQLILAGANGRADLPGLDGAPAGDDVLFASTVIGQGMAPNLLQSGRFSTSFYPPPPSGARVYVRVFNAPSLPSATRWGQSGVHVVHCCTVFDASLLGLRSTTIPMGSDPLSSDSDGDGVSDYDELVSNTNASDEDDFLEAQVMVGMNAFEVDGRAGRSYSLLRTTDDLTGDMTWITVMHVGTLASDQKIVLSDPEPLEETKAFYRIEVISP